MGSDPVCWRCSLGRLRRLLQTASTVKVRTRLLAITPVPVMRLPTHNISSRFATWIAAASLLLLAAPSHAQVVAGSVRRGVVISEIHHTSYSSGLGTYIELINLNPLLPVNLAGASITIGQPATPPTTLTLPSAAVNVYSRTNDSGVITLFDPSSGPFPGPGANNVAIPTSTLFNNPVHLAPGQATFILLQYQVAGNTQSDLVALNWPTGVSLPAGGTFSGSISHGTGLTIRHYRVDSDTSMDFMEMPMSPPPPDPPYVGPFPGPSPNTINPEMSRVTALFFGSPNAQFNATGVAFPSPAVQVINSAQVVSGLNSPPSTATININNLQGALGYLEFMEHPYAMFRRVNNPMFDPVFTMGQLTVNATLNGDGAFLAHETNTTGANPVSPGMIWQLRVPDPFGMNDGVVDINMGPLDQAGVLFDFYNATPSVTPNGNELRISRILTDNLTDGTAGGMGNLTKVQLDLLPPSEPPGDTWCEMIVHHPNGFSYRAKARNWPANPTNCNTPTLGLGSNAIGNLDLIALCFDPTAPKELFILPSQNVAGMLGSGPLFGIIPDPLTFSFLAAPLGTHPAHVTVTVDGMYFWGLTDPGLSGLSLDAAAIEYDPTPGMGFGSWTISQTNTITVL